MIAPHIEAELAAAGLLGLPFAWGADGAVQYGPTLTLVQQAAIAAVFAAHDPNDAVKIAAYQATVREADFNQQKMIKAVAIWTAQKLGVPLATARAEILAIYKDLP